MLTRWGTVGLALSAAAACGRADTQRPAVELREVTAFEIPADFPLRGIAAGSSGTLVMWGTRSPTLLVRRGDDVAPLRPIGVRVPVGVAFVEGDSIIDIVDQAGPTVIRATLAGRVVARWGCTAPITVATAARTTDSWIIAGAAVDSSYGIARLRDGEDACSLRTMAKSGPLPFAGSLSSTFDGRSALLAGVNAPYQVFTVDSTGQVSPLTGSATPLVAVAARGQSRPPRWLGMAVLPLDRNSRVQVFADARSDRRLIRVYDTDGRLRSEKTIAVPFGFVGSVPDRRTLFALRRTDRVEVVTYTWGAADEAPRAAGRTATLTP